jgi:hypothetical protein
MPQNELLVDVLRRNIGLVKMTLGDMTDADLAQRPAPAANNGLWQIGHLIAAEARLVNGCAGRTVIELPAGFADKFKRETVSVNEPEKLGSKADLLALFEKVRNTTADWVGTLTAADLAKPAPEPIRERVPTVGHVAHMLTGHVCMHMGQVQALRRKLGKPVLF